MKQCATCTAQLPAAALQCIYCGAKQQVGAPPVARPTLLGHPGQGLEAARRAAPQRDVAHTGDGLNFSTFPERNVEKLSPSPLQVRGIRASTPGPGAFAPPPEPAFDSRPAVVARPRRSPAPADYGPPVAPPSPWAGSIRAALLCFGLLLVACAVAPWTLGDGTATFAWTAWRAPLPFAVKMVPVLLGATGLTAVIVGAAPLSTTARGFCAVALGGAPLVFQLAAADALVWQDPAWTAGMAALVCGLLLRSRHGGPLFGRVVASAGALTVVLVFAMPVAGQVPVVALAQQLVASAGEARLALIFEPRGPVPLVLTLLSLMVVWLPASSWTGAAGLAWLLLLWPLAASLGPLWLGDAPLAALRADLVGTLYLPLAALAWLGLTGYGVASVCGEQLEEF